MIFLSISHITLIYSNIIQLTFCNLIKLARFECVQREIISRSSGELNISQVFWKTAYK